MNQEGVEKRRVTKYDPIAVGDQGTVVAEYVAEGPTSEEYQSEAQLEKELIRILQTQAYDYLPIHTAQDLIANLRFQLEILNNVIFSDAEWERFYRTCITSANDGRAAKTRRIHEEHIQVLTRDDGTSKNIRLLDKSNIHNNRLQVINQYEVEQGEGGANHANRYDVTILVNGLPMVHIELKRRGVDIREAFNQISRYQRDSFWSGDGLFDYVQLFVISNGTLTKYYSNTTRELHIKETNGNGGKARGAKSFEFTSWWADAKNNPIRDLVAFTKTFLSKHTILNILTKYCVFSVAEELLVMRPYQIVAAEKILQRIEISNNYKKRLGKTEGGGYIWHTTGSGKTLTSFKAAQLASKLPHVDKVLFVVDRKDLDYQTMREYDRFQKGAANSNTSTEILKKQLEDGNATIIITTIQKLSNFIARHKEHPVYDKHVVIIFDECHRSQFGDMHSAITTAFKKYNLFGFTGTPIFADNSTGGAKARLKTTEEAFGERLHAYTIVDAITDKNVLPFRIDYINTIAVGNVKDKEVCAIDTEGALLAEERLKNIVDYTLKHFAQKTKRESFYQHRIVSNVSEVAKARYRSKVEEIKRNQRVRGFNAIFATASVEAAYTYYQLFKEAQSILPEAERLKIAMIYSFAPNENEKDEVPEIPPSTAEQAAAEESTGLLHEEAMETEQLPKVARDHLDTAIADYNGLFKTNYDTSADKFQNYYKDLSLRMKNREVDLTIVVNMFLTGFDATTMNTLFVDKNLKYHGLIQAFSRTNRILNSVKTYGNIVSFRNLDKETNEALRLFGDTDAATVVLLKPYADYFEEYKILVSKLLTEYPLDKLIVGEQAQKSFISLFGAILRVQNILTSFDQFAEDAILTPRQEQDYRSIYLDLYAEFRGKHNGTKESINDDVSFELELIKQVEINVDYILMLVDQYRETHAGDEGKEIRAQISRAANSSPSLRNKRDLIEDFVDAVNLTQPVDRQWQQFISHRRQADLNAIIAEEKLRMPMAQSFVEEALATGIVNALGTDIVRLLPPMSRFTPNNEREKVKSRVLERIKAFVERYRNLGSTMDREQ